MKSIFASASILALAIAVPAFAQAVAPTAVTPSECVGATNNCSVVNQSGDNQIADVTQDGANDDSSISQADDSNYAFVSQTGIVGNLSNVTQSGSAANQGNTVEVVQSDSGEAIVDGDYANTSVIEQTAGLNEAYILQISDSDQGPTSSNASSVQQTGASNYAAAAQSGGGLLSEVLQTTSGNFAVVNQGIPFATLAFGNTSQITQGGGDGNLAFVTQAGNESRSFVEQIGVGNTSTINQAFASDDNDADVLQSGDDNESLIMQGGGNGNFANVDQLSNGNTSFVSQDGTGNIANVTQGS